MTTLPTQDQVDASTEPHIERLRRHDSENTGYKPYVETTHQLSKLTGIPWSTAATI